LYIVLQYRRKTPSFFGNTKDCSIGSTTPQFLGCKYKRLLYREKESTVPWQYKGSYRGNDSPVWQYTGLQYGINTSSLVVQQEERLQCSLTVLRAAV